MVQAGLLAVMALLAAAEPPVEPRRPGQDSFITRAVFAEGRLWMRSDAGVLFSIAPEEAQVREERLPAPVLDLCARNGHLLAVTWSAKKWNVLRHEGSRWFPEAAFDAPDHLIGIDCSPEALTLVAATRVLVAKRGAKARVIRLSESLRSGLVQRLGGLTAPTNIFIDGQDLYVGFNQGEWGGGLLRARLTDGRVSLIDRPSGDLCGGVLNAMCDPVQAIAPLPWKPGCVVAAVGLVHFRPRGSLVEVCGEQVRALLPRQVPVEGTNSKSSVAFFGVTATGNTLVAVGLDGLYRVSERGVEREPLPTFKDVGGIRVSFDARGLALVMTDVNARKSVSGSVPMLVPMP